MLFTPTHLCFIKFAYRIGVITPYKQQLRELKNRFERQYGRDILNVIDFNTVVSNAQMIDLV
jgi:superfamily I DNA and/or RNA helicase